MKSLVLLCLFVGLGSVRGFNLCYDAADRIDNACVTCTCELDPVSGFRKWACVQTCEVCPMDVISQVCIVNQCDVGLYCTAHPDAECVITDCNTCDFAWHKNGTEVDCRNVGGCPQGVDMVQCLLNPCLTASCPQHPTAFCTADYCGGCNAVFTTAQGEVVDCGSPEYPDRCPADQPFTNCTYDEVCSSPCSAVPVARCRVDHCGGCTPFYLDSLGFRLNCTTGDVTGCPRVINRVPCGLNMCSFTECATDPMARCVANNCGQCHPAFFNDQGQYINCETGEASVCPPGLVENSATTAEACSNATCPANPKAWCVARQCLSPNMPLECPYEFIGPRGLPVRCMPTNDELTYPVIVKPGTCPEPSMDAGDTCSDECHEDYGDAGCPRHWKCCFDGCGHVCTPPQEMVDSCPVVPGNAGGNNCEERCSSDMDCHAVEPGSKCCSHGCGTRCKTPIRAEKPGTCPVSGMIVASGNCSESCSSDDDCPDSKKCCRNGCDRSCLDPQEQPGECPRAPDDLMLLASTQLPCTSDQDCQGRRSKCCAYGCGQICVEPVEVERHGMCPLTVLMGSRPCSKICNGDQDCPDNTKCCGGGCVCSTPEETPGECPAPAMNTSGICAELCSGDQDCPRGRKCCSNGCGRTCTVPLVVKAGMCPVPPTAMVGICAELCTGDQDCHGNRKCCSNGCGHTCTKPIDTPASCPIVPDDYSGTCVEGCRPGSKCPRGQKCCYNGCVHVCQRPVPIECEEDELSEVCDPDPCQHATCPSVSEAVCVTSKCGRCRPKFFVDLAEVQCTGQKTCMGVDGDNTRYVAGTSRDSSDGCNQCVCTGRGIWMCTQRKCDKVIKIVMKLNGTFERIMNRTDNFIGKLKKVLSTRFPALSATSMRDFRVRKGSIIVEFKVSSSNVTTASDLENTVEMMKSKVSAGLFSLEFEGENLRADSNFFQSEDISPPTSSAVQPLSGAKNLVVYIVIGVICGLVVRL